MKNRRFFIGVLLLLMTLNVLASDTLYENYPTGNEDSQLLFGTNSIRWAAQTFTPSTTHNITSIKWMLYKFGNPTGNLTAVITSIIDSNKPNEEDILCISDIIGAATLTTDTNGVLYEFIFGSPAELTATIRYASILKSTGDDSSNYVKAKEDASSATYAGGNALLTIDGGSEWALYANDDFIFYEYGTISGSTTTTTAGGSVIPIIMNSYKQRRN